MENSCAPGLWSDRKCQLYDVQLRPFIWHIGQSASPSEAPSTFLLPFEFKLISPTANFDWEIYSTHAHAHAAHITQNMAECNMQFACTRDVRRAKRQNEKNYNIYYGTVITNYAHCTRHIVCLPMVKAYIFPQLVRLVWLCSYACGKSHLTQSAKPKAKRRIIWHADRQLTSSVMPTVWLSTRPL